MSSEFIENLGSRPQKTFYSPGLDLHFCPASGLNLRPTQPHTQLVLCLGVKRPERAFDSSVPSSVQVKNEWSCSSDPSGYPDGVDRDSFIYSFMHFMVTTLDHRVVFALLGCYAALTDNY